MNLPRITAIALAALLAVACDQSARTMDTVATPEAVDQQAQYTCPMHPHYTDHDPAGTCPICGMNLVPMARDTGQTAQDNSISVESGMLQTMGVRTVAAQTVSLGRSLRAFGTVERDERLENVSASRIEGWIKDLRVRAEGDAVRPGALLYRVYSPDLISAQKDYLSSLTVGNDKRTAAVLQRLRSLGMQAAAVDRLAQTKSVLERVPVYAESGGTVAQLKVREGDYIKPGTPVLRLQSYAGVWVIARVPERDLSLIDAGMAVRLDFPSAPNAPANGRINYVYPTIDPKTRTGEIRIEVDNSAGLLRPGAYANIVFELSDQPRLSVPTEAVLTDSRGDHVIIALGDGRFAGRSIHTGIKSNGRTEVLHGLREGERVVASGQFMLDSEINLREGLSKLGSPNDATDHAHVGH